MADEQRVIRVTTVVNAAARDLNRIADILDKVGTATGKSDKELRQMDTNLARMSARVRAAQREMATLYETTDRLSKSNTAYRSQVQRLTTQLEAQRMTVRSQRAEINSLIALNKKLGESYDAVAASARRVPATPGRVGGGVRTGAGLDDLSQASELTNSLRYQLYDVAATFGIIGATVLAAGTAVTRAGIEWDKNFANVVRTSQTTGTAVEWLKEEFLDLQSAIPVSSADLATIATLGAQMGVAAANLSRFTEVTAQFSATAGISVDEAATALSRLDQLLPDVAGNYELLASTILKTGVNAVATEQQIVRSTNQIAAMGRIAGLNTPEIVALASAMSSLGFSPELSRSIVTSSFSRILTATSQVTAQTEKFGAVLNMTGKEFQQAWRADAVGTYRDLLQTIASRGDAVTVLQSLGLASQRLTPNLLKLGQNTDVLNEALGDTRSEWESNTELARQYGIISDTVSARIQVMSQAWEALLVTLDDSDVVLKPLIDGLTGVLRFLRSIAKNPAVSAFVSMGTAVAVLAGVTALAAAGLAAMSAGYIAVNLATAGLAAFRSADTASLGANTAAVITNDVARARATFGLAANDLALGTNTASLGANTAANLANGASVSASGAKLLGFSSNVIAALPAILRFTGLIGLAAAGTVGLAALLAEMPNIAHDLNKFVGGIDTPDETIDFDIEKLNTAIHDLDAGLFQSKLDSIKEGLASGDGYSINGNLITSSDVFAAALDDMTNDPQVDLDVVSKDLTEEILSLGNLESQYAAVNYVAQELGVTQEDLLTNILPDLGSAMGDTAVEGAVLQEEMEQLEASSALWAAALGATDEQLSALKTNLQSGANAFFDFGDAMERAYDTSGDAGTGGGINGLLSNIQGQVTSFEEFYGKLGQLVQRGGINLAAGFAEQGPAAMQALTDSLNLTPEQIAQVEANMSLAAFYASEEFANTFSQNNAILAEVWRQSGNNPEAVAAFNEALSASMKGGAVDPQVLAELSDRFGVKLDAQLIPSLDPDQFAIAERLVAGNVTKVTIPVDLGLPGAPEMQELDSWIVSMTGEDGTLRRLAIPVDPNTEKGSEIIQRWIDSGYGLTATPEVILGADTNLATQQLNAWIAAQQYRTITFGVRLGTGAYANKAVPQKDGGWAGNIKAFAGGGGVRGPGTSTSDSILAALSKGEWVHRAAAVRYYGPKMMDDINKLRFPKFATGGMVGGPGWQGAGSSTVVNATVNQFNPVTRDPIKQLRDDAQGVLAGIWV